MNKTQVEKIVNEVVEGWDEKEHPRDGDGQFAASATSGVARHAPGKGTGSLKERQKRRMAVGGPEHDDDPAHHAAYEKAPGKITTKGGTTLYKAGWDNMKKKPVYVSVPGRD